MQKKSDFFYLGIYSRIFAKDMDSNKTTYLLSNIKAMMNKECFWFCLGAAFGLFCGSTVFEIYFTNLTIGSYICMVIWAFIFGLIYKDLGSVKATKNGAF